MTSPYTGSSVITSTFTGLEPVDSLLEGSQWASTSVSYSFPGPFAFWSLDTVVGYGPFGSNQEPWSDWYQALANSDMGAVRQALAAWANVSRLRFTEVADTAVTVGDLRFAYSHLPGTDVEEAQAWAYSPAAAPYGGDVWFNATGSSYFERWSPGTYSYLSSIHEIGHALGLKHPFEISQVGDETLNPTIIDPSLDSRSYTVMSYSAAPGDSSTYFDYEPTTLMVLDIAAVQALYGSNSGYKSGASSYVFQQSAQYHQTLWDAGGIDTISYISTEGGIVDLRAGTDFGSRLGRAIHVTDSAGNNLFAVNNIWIAYGTVIENAIGGSGNDQITGNDVANTLNGGLGSDTLTGGLGDDTYVIDNLGDAVVEALDAGTDLARIAIGTPGGTVTLWDNVENATLVNAVAFNLTGNALNNTLTGNGLANTLDGGAGDDLLDGKAGADLLIGGLGDDTFVIDNPGDAVVEALDAGTDLVKVARTTPGGTFTLADNVENATLVNAVAFNLTGNALNNTLTGNGLANVLDGGLGADALIGGLGNDTYVIDDAGDTITDTGGVDTVKSSLAFTLGVNLENLTLTGTADLDGTGNGLANLILGNSGANVLDGGAGDGKVDTLKGGDGHDTYRVDLTAANGFQDVVAEALNQGTDTVVLRGGNTLLATYATLALGLNLENLDASGTTTAKLNLTGNAGANTLTGNDAANTLNGGLGADVLIGGLGDDTYVIDHLGDTVVEALDAGTDLVKVAIGTPGGTVTLWDNVENA
ncbi:MAG TPA: M10 family metallopeptidase, partial [Rhodocyclaceae bacterium]|nr:M10 family metallopeptidase [Rhodocyclaceae bacterium]